MKQLQIFFTRTYFIPMTFVLLGTGCTAGFEAASATSSSNFAAGDDGTPTPTPTPAMPTPTPTPIVPTPTPTPAPPIGQCLPKDFPMLWPVGGTAYKDWTAHNFVDLNLLAGSVLDYMGSTASMAQTYDGHKGIDVDVASFRQMDENFAVHAVADGTVTETYASSFDRNLGGTIENCSKDQANYVKLVHANGFTTIYAHLKKNSVVVSVGQKVKEGEKLGVIGSSGCSTAPHLHLETYDCKGQLVEPMKESMFKNPPMYTLMAPTTIMETFILQPSMTDVKQLQDPAPEPKSVKAGQSFSVAFTLANVKMGDKLHVNIYDPTGALQNFAFDAVAKEFFAMSHWVSDYNLAALGEWRFEFQVNGKTQLNRTILIEPLVQRGLGSVQE